MKAVKIDRFDSTQTCLGQARGTFEGAPTTWLQSPILLKGVDQVVRG